MNVLEDNVTQDSVTQSDVLTNLLKVVVFKLDKFIINIEQNLEVLIEWNVVYVNNNEYLIELIPDNDLKIISEKKLILKDTEKFIVRVIKPTIGGCTINIIIYGLDIVETIQLDFRKPCSCKTNLTNDFVLNTIKELRIEDGINSEKLFQNNNCKIPSDDKSLEKFTSMLNSLFNKYDITTCIRKVHFIAQIFHETDRLQTTKEYNTEANYKPYIGRGLMQLTHKSNYLT